ncbi:MAG: hypothetical protein UV73_C0007G0062 [Candidatus Gottesmanbacteria bacterium GW2011_GWA2_43_14]|uniref:Nucleotidase n=1 Tax=Candidatus Gottesmanbacteria bacterium GW2011_GWA2_43_14 TaxID=1618443 RepID=A0A0G1DIX8_9BACT|nr:MAG: hypothetical protein UV73_C0007G0062 [Candidatus Gottesmanbacteria bacterium GW2011_GWA2_43_14]
MKKPLYATIGIDIDNTICDSYPAYLEKYNIKYRKQVQLTEILDFYYLNNLANQEGAGLSGFIDELVLSEEFQISLRPVIDAPEAIHAWSREGHRIHYVTARPIQMYKVTKKWLEKHGFWFTNTRLDLFNPKKGYQSDIDYKITVAEKSGIKVFIEDAGEIASALKIPVFLFDRPWNRGKMPDNVQRVTTWEEIGENLPDVLQRQP